MNQLSADIDVTNTHKPIFFCAIGGSGMLPLAMIMNKRGTPVAGSDRSNDQGRTPERFTFIQKQGLTLFPQDGSGITQDTSRVVVSAAIEKTVPDYQAALAKNIPIISRAGLLAELFNATETSIAVAGTSGKSTTTGMTAWILHHLGRAPTVMNGAIMKNFVTPAMPFASALVGSDKLFVAEVDESDGSIDLFTPTIAVLNNVALDHKSMDELRGLFTRFIQKAQKIVINLDNNETKALAAKANNQNIISYSLTDSSATLFASAITPYPDGIGATITHTSSGESATIRLRVPGHHNLSNGLAAIGAALSVGIGFSQATAALSLFEGMARRLDVIGTKNEITVIDDFAHNPDKIGASLRTLHQFEGRLLILFQPHGYGPLRLMRRELVDCFVQNLGPQDHLFMPDPLYLGGTTDRSVTSADLVSDIKANNRQATHCALREDCAKAILATARAGDRILIMGARDDTLPQLGRDILKQLP